MAVVATDMPYSNSHSGARVHATEKRFLERRAVDREGGSERRQLGRRFRAEVEKLHHLCRIPMQERGALEEGAGAGAALGQADDLAAVDGDLAGADPGE